MPSLASVPPKIKKSNKSFVRYDKKKSVYHLTTGDSLKTTAGHDVLIECTASGTPEPNVIWEMNSLELKNSSRTYLYPNGTLRIEDLKYTDSGLYKCMALNSKGVDTSVSLLVILGEFHELCLISIMLYILT